MLPAEEAINQISRDLLKSVARSSGEIQILG